MSFDPLAVGTLPAGIDGERDRFDLLYRRWFGPVVRLCRRHLGPEYDAEAVAQEAFIRAWRSWSRYAEDRPFGPWVATIARRLCLSEQRRGARRGRIVGTAPPLPDQVDDGFLVALHSDAVARALRTLAPRARRLIVLHHVEAWTYEEIAQVDGVTIESVKSALKRARLAFRMRYEDIAGLPAAVAAVRPSSWQRLRRFFESLPPRLPSLEPAAAAAVLLLAPVAPAVMPADGLPLTVAGPPAVAPVPAEEAGLGTVQGVGPDAPAVGSEAVQQLQADLAPVADGVDAAGLGGYYSFAVSPNYAEDHTVFAIGRSTPCTRGACLVLLRSTDGGETWSRRRAAGVLAAERPSVLLPPSYPHDRRIFVHAGGGDGLTNVLAVSHDDGDTFAPMTSGGGPWAGLALSMSPRFSAGDPRILIAATDYQPALVYRDDSKALEPLRLPLPVGARPNQFVFGDQADGAVIVAATLPLASTTVLRCTPTGCSTVLTVPWLTPLQLAAGDDRSQRSVLAWTPTTLYRSDDDGRSFEPVPAPGAEEGGELVDVVPDRAGRVLALVAPRAEAERELFESIDSGATWARLSVPSTASIHRLAVLPDGVLLASLFSNEHSLACSVDGGRTWASRCRRAA